MRLPATTQTRQSWLELWIDKAHRVYLHYLVGGKSALVIDHNEYNKDLESRS
jgi:hypothetical protein